MTDKKVNAEKVTAPGSSVGADGEQALSKNNYEKSIADLHVEGNLQATDFCGFGTFDTSCQKKYEQEDLQTVTMEELYDTVYPPKVPIVEGLVYAGTYLFVGAPKVGKSFFMAQLGYHVSRGFRCGITRCARKRFCTLHWKMIMPDCRNVCQECSDWKALTVSILQQGQNL